jgi:hypothetical protein
MTPARAPVEHVLKQGIGMPFTDKELVKKHLVDFRVGQAEVQGFPMVLSGSDPVQLPHSGLVPSSVVVKANECSAPVAESITIGDDWIDLEHADLVPGSVVIANNTSLSTIYTENIDFTVDAIDGRIKRISAGSISFGQAAAVWYFHYHRYTAGSDYAVDAATGQVRRLSNGAIEDGQTVLVDYIAEFGTVTEDAIDQAIGEAGQAILQVIDAQFHDSTDPGLIAAETYWAVALLCRVRAAAELSGSSLKTSATAPTAKTWMDLAGHYYRLAEERLRPFRAAVPSMRCPTFVSRQ